MLGFLTFVCISSFVTQKNKQYGDMERRANNYYDVRAQDVKLEDVTSSEHNAKILRMLRDDDLASTEEEEGALYIVDCTKDYGNTFFVKEGDDWGWLGYFIGRNKQISNVHLFYLPKDGEEVSAFMDPNTTGRLSILISSIKLREIL